MVVGAQSLKTQTAARKYTSLCYSKPLGCKWYSTVGLHPGWQGVCNTLAALDLCLAAQIQ